MIKFWEAAFVEKQMMWGLEPAQAAVLAAERFAKYGARDVLIPGIGYGRNAKPFLAQSMSVTGIEISSTAIALARTQLGLTLPIHHGSVAQMPFDNARYDGIFCFGMLYLLDAAARAKMLLDCMAQLRPGGHMVFTVIAKTAPMYGRGTHLAEDWYETFPGLTMYFYDEASVAREFGPHGLVACSYLNEPTPAGGTFPFIQVLCRRAHG